MGQNEFPKETPIFFNIHDIACLATISYIALLIVYINTLLRQLSWLHSHFVLVD